MNRYPWPKPRGRAGEMTGLGVYRPRRVVENAEIAARFGIDDEWIVSRTGVRRRRHAAADETLVHMGSEAARAALAQAGLAASQVDFLLLATMTNTRQVPALAPLVARRIGADHAGASDLQAACAGFVYGLAHASGLIAAGSATHVLVVATERLTDITDPLDRDTAVILADGAGAAVVSACEEPGFSPVVWGADGAAEESFVLVPAPPERNPTGSQQFVRMHGRDLARRFGPLMPEVARKVMTAAQMTWEDLDALVPHQANLRFIREWRLALELPDRVALATSITEDGNTSAASIPLALDSLMAAKAVRPGDRALLLGFGVGITWAGLVARLP
ncbi:beta-ketoacyl-ACP synthase 3 [Streptomyces sp. NPDC005876]|uniref:beta-ketoacyl-ACP synthase 3 n=1 Tax=Streptomyces sp. NPDC005876 TaxID=3157076 RepID=UPI0033E582CE